MAHSTLQSDRINLRLVCLSDLNAIHELHLFPEVDEFNTLGIPTEINETRIVVDSWIYSNNKHQIENYTFIIEETKAKSFIGTIGLKLWNKKNNKGEVWYKIHPKYWNKGFATEAVNLILDYGFDELNLHRIQAGCAVENIASIKVLEKVGMIKEGRGRKVLPLKNGWSDNFEYSILETDPRKK